MQKFVLADFENEETSVDAVFNTSVVLTPKESRIIPIQGHLEFPLENSLNSFFKRSFDVIFSLLIITFCLSWLIPLLAIIIKINSKGPVFFTQKRTGINNKSFFCRKFRTMYINEEADSKQASPDDPRITTAGRFMRKFSLDETPQFFNVLRGYMSVVGPRPHMLSHTEAYSKQVDNYMVRHFVKPGITGLAQVKGYRGEISNSLMLHNRIRLDIFYIRQWNFMMDLRIIFKTFKLVLFGDKNAS